MKNLSILLTLGAALAVSGCGKIGKIHKGLPDDGQLHGVAPASKYNLSKPPEWFIFHPEPFTWVPAMKTSTTLIQHVTNRFP